MFSKSYFSFSIKSSFISLIIFAIPLILLGFKSHKGLIRSQTPPYALHRFEYKSAPPCSASYKSGLPMSLNDPPMELCEENLEVAMEELRQALGTLFGYDEASRKVGITGQIELVDIDGPTIAVALSGRFWHATDTVMARVESYIRQRIPEIIEVKLDFARSSIIDDNRLNNKQIL